MSTITLRVSPPTGSAFLHRFRGESMTIGRSSTCDLSLPDASLSRRHARIFSSTSGWMIEDLGSRNGTRIEGRLIRHPVSLHTGDLATLSASRIEVVPDAVDSAMETPRPGPDLLERVLTPPPERVEATIPSGSREPLSILLDVHRTLCRPATVDELLTTILDRVFDYLQPDQTAIFLRRDDGRIDQTRCRSVDESTCSFVVSDSLIERVTEGKSPVITDDIATDSHLAESDSLQSAGVRSLLAVPLLTGIETGPAQGMIVLSTIDRIHRYGQEDLDLLSSLASVAALRLHNATLEEDATERRRLEHELRIARTIQVRLMPQRIPDLPGYDLRGSSLPSAGVSGDYYEIDRTGDGRCVLLVADVSGKGIGASLLAGYLEAQLSCYIDEGLAPDEIFERVSRRLHRRTRTGNFATAVLAFLEPEAGRVLYANAGHPPGLIFRRAGAVDRIASTGLPLGLFADSAHALRSVTLDPGDLLLLYTDGITEAADPDGEEYGLDRLVEVGREHRRLGLDGLAHRLECDLFEHAGPAVFDDDRTLVMVRRH